MRPYSSKLVEFISSWIALGWSGMESFAPRSVSKVKRSPPCCEMRA
jgi:hypothetical protein